MYKILINNISSKYAQFKKLKQNGIVIEYITILIYTYNGVFTILNRGRGVYNSTEISRTLKCISLNIVYTNHSINDNKILKTCKYFFKQK